MLSLYCGLASRFVSGYLVSSAAVEDQATTHARAEIYLPGAGATPVKLEIQRRTYYC